MTTEWIDADWLLSALDAPIHRPQVGISVESGCINAVEIRHSDDQRHPGTTLLTPGLINAHTHIELYDDVPLPLEEGDTLANWIIQVVNRQRRLTGDDRQRACQQSLTELIRTGTTCINDISGQGDGIAMIDRLGMRAVVSTECFYPFPDPPGSDSPFASRFERWRTRWQELKTRWGDHPLIKLGISPHSPYNVTPQAWQAMLNATDPWLVHTHLCESPDEMALFRTGDSPLNAMHQTLLGQVFPPSKIDQTPIEAIADCLNEKTVAAHGIYLTDDDRQLLAERGTGLVHCPHSNHWINAYANEAPATMDWHAAHQAGIRLGLGTDSRLSSSTLDIREEARTAQPLHGLSAQTLFEHVTLHNARLLQWADVIGQILPGFAADMVLWWNPSVTDPLPETLYDLWLAPETEPILVWINGRMVLDRSQVWMAV